MKVIFFGTPKFAAETLAFLLDNKINIVAVVTKPDRPQGRSREPVPTPVKKTLLSLSPSIPLFQPEIVSEADFAPTLTAFDADLFVVVAYGEILRQHLLDMPHLACINVHYSLLPKYRGAAPIQQAILNGETETGISIIHMVKKMDAGDIIKMTHVPIGENTTFGELGEQLCVSGCQAILEVLREYETGSTPDHYAQDEQQITFAKKIELEDCQIDWQKPASFIHNLVRGVNPEPGAWCIVNIKGENKRLKIKQTRLIKDISGTPGSILSYGKEGFVVSCSAGAIEILELQLEGKKPMHSLEFTRGIQVTFQSSKS
ncbi:MAG: methionyl-tRNA formyltransferase [Parachlamydiaceae bacterium]|nr:methionyl-tRNA formyltransferase [Parachlamydiaceae bacterium]